MSADIPTSIAPDKKWPHFEVWQRVRSLVYSLPDHFNTELVIKGINVTEIFSLGAAFTSVVDAQVVDILNGLRNLWDPDNKHSNFSFVRQAQTFPDVLLRNQEDEQDIIFGLELKSWYVLSKEGEPSFRYQITAEACAEADLLVVVPWLLSEVISGTPRLLRPYVESARYVAEYRNDYWSRSRIERGQSGIIRKPQPEYRHPYPKVKQEASDEAVEDKGGNFGRIARTGILEDFVASTKHQEYLGVKILHWIAFFKAICETSTDVEIGKKLETLRSQILGSKAPAQRQLVFLEILDRLEALWTNA